jgi:hypothetical protein
MCTKHLLKKANAETQRANAEKKKVEKALQEEREARKKAESLRDKQPPQETGSRLPAAVTAPFRGYTEVLAPTVPEVSGNLVQDPVQGGSDGVQVLVFRRASSFGRWLQRFSGNPDDGQPKTPHRRLTFDRKDKKKDHDAKG